MESRLAHDFSQVRIHSDATAAESARAVGALAYTVGQHIAFAPGRYAPGTSEGRRLLAHELAHVIQQRSGLATGAHAGGDLSVNDPADRFEHEARLVAETATSGVRTARGGVAVQSAVGDRVVWPGQLTLLQCEKEKSAPGTKAPGAAAGKPASGPHGATADCPVPSSWGSYAKKPGGDGTYPASTGTSITQPKSTNGAFGVSFNKNDSWVDSDQVAIGKSRIKVVSDVVKNCKAKIGASEWTWNPDWACPAAKVGRHTANNKGECETVIGAGLDKDYIADAGRLLRHEQYHVRLACALAAAATAALPPRPSQADIDTAFSGAQKQHQANDDRYDSETDHGCNSEKQAGWERNIDAGKI